MSCKGFKLRIDIFAEEDKVRMKEYVASVASAYLVVYEEKEDGRNPHCHAAFYTTFNEKKLRYLFRQKFMETHINVKGSHSLGELWEGEENHVGHFRYLCKGVSVEEQPVVVAASGMLFTKEEIEKRHEEFWKENDNKPRKRKRVKEELSIEDEVLRQCREKKITVNNHRAVAEIILRTIRERRRGYTKYELERKVNMIMLQLDVDEDKFFKFETENIMRMMSR